jgi:hypothetical protein
LAQFEALDPRVEVNGETVLAVVAGMGVFKSAALQLLAENGIEFPEPGDWFPQQAWLNSFKVIAERVGDGTLRSIGRAIPEHAQWPPAIDSIRDALASIDVAYHLNHRIGGRLLFDHATGTTREGIGHYRFEERAPREALVVCDDPYPCAFDVGIVEAVAERFCEAGDRVRVEHLGPACRRSGAAACSYRVTW